MLKYVRIKLFIYLYNNRFVIFLLHGQYRKVLFMYVLRIRVNCVGMNHL